MEDLASLKVDIGSILRLISDPTLICRSREDELEAQKCKQLQETSTMAKSDRHEKQQVIDEEDFQTIFVNLLAKYTMVIRTIQSISDTIDAYPDRCRMWTTLSGMALVVTAWCVRQSYYEPHASRIVKYKVWEGVSVSIVLLGNCFGRNSNNTQYSLPLHVSIAISAVIAVFVGFVYSYVSWRLEIVERNNSGWRANSRSALMYH